MNRFERPDDEIYFSTENSEVIQAEIENFEKLLSEMVDKGSNPMENLVELTRIVDSIKENDPSFLEILDRKEREADPDGGEKLPGQAMMEALEEYALEKTNSKKE